MRLSPAEQLLQELGVTDPAEIDLEAIAFYKKAQVRFRPLDGCEARIIGTTERAIITVNRDSQRRRRRFSIAHELGHWHHHRGHCLACRVDEYRPKVGASSERTADSYAADLLMPNYLFRPLARMQKKMNFATIKTLADVFDASQTATAIRLIESDHTPSMLVCHGKKGRKWFVRSPSVPDRWFPQEDLDAESYAFGVQFGTDLDNPFLRKIGADAWFDRIEADRFEIQEQTVRVGPEETLTLLVFLDDEMLE
ncbi:ImmA/IrrE family metallo-endopeptidase [Rhodospirillum sp. A1_3_36]|uniref:ImmA/IrrE family metallo-endopeptidase n=1 Tax=Rhodospirillum sp. A1_3_36 TaxID=3391666 RepID=UPI0039A48BFD